MGCRHTARDSATVREIASTLMPLLVTACSFALPVTFGRCAVLRRFDMFHPGCTGVCPTTRATGRSRVSESLTPSNSDGYSPRLHHNRRTLRGRTARVSGTWRIRHRSAIFVRFRHGS